MAGTIRVVVFDRSGAGRELQMVESLSAACADVSLITSEGRYRAPELGRSVKLSESFDLAVVHGSDEREWRKEDRHASITVFYSAGSRRARTVQTESEFWIQRSVATQREALTSKEAVELLEWVERFIDRGKPPFLPSVLRREEEVRVLSALVILCQGYLAVHSDPKQRRPELSAGEGKALTLVRRAQEQMGWYDIDSCTVDSRLLEAKSRRGLQRKVREAGWWCEALSEVELLERVEEEWGENDEDLWSSVGPLLFALEKGERVKPAEVASCFLALCEKLGTTWQE